MEAQQQVLGGRYTLLDELGRGGMAVVWRARDEVLGRSVAVKVLAGRYAEDPQWRARIRDEARTAATLSHPTIAQVYDFGESAEHGRLVPYVVMELVHGITLHQRMKAGPVPAGQVFRICAQVAAALAAAHADGLVHRDIKPGNVMVTDSGAKVVDFGLAAMAGPVDPDDEVFGTPAYLAPERLTGGPVEPASDVYALGVLMYRLLAGESPWTVDTTTQMLKAHVYVEPAPLGVLDDVPLQVTDLVNRCLSKEPADRPSAAQVTTVLTRAALVARPVTPPPAAAPVPARRARKPLLIGGLAAAVVAALLGWLLLPDDARREAEVASSAPASVFGRSGTGVAPDGTAGPATRPGAAEPGLTAGTPSVTASAGAVPVPVPVTSKPPATSRPPTTSTPSPTVPITADPPADDGTVRTFTSPGGTVEARCGSGGRAELLSWTPEDTYDVQRVTEGPALAAVVVFKKEKAASRIRMTVTCVADTPTAVTLPL